MEEVIELEYPPCMHGGLFGPRDVPRDAGIADAAESDSDPLPVVIVDCEGSGDAD